MLPETNDALRDIRMEKRRERHTMATCHQLAVGQVLGIAPEFVCISMETFDVWLGEQGYYRKVFSPKHLPEGTPCVAIYLSKQVSGALHAEYVADGRYIKTGCIAVEVYAKLGDADDG